MRTHTSEFKEELKVFGRQIQGKITYYPSYDLVSESDDNILTEADLQIISEQANYDEPIEISEEDIFSISIIKNGDLLQSLMKEFDFETKEELNIGSVVNPQFGLLVNENYEYLNYGNYIINSKEFNMDTETWSYVCYDKMLFSMVKYRGLKNIEYPITIKQFINKLCDKVGLEFEDSDFVNQDQLIYEDLYKNRDVTYRDIFDEISKVVGGNLLINDDDKLEVGYPEIKKTLFNFDNYYSESGNIQIVTQTSNKLVATVSTASTWQQIQYKIDNLEKNTDYAFSFDFENTQTTELYQHSWITIKGGTTNNNLFNSAYYKGDVITFNTGDYTEVRFAFHVTINAPAVINTITISNVRLEKGTSLLEYDTINEDYLKDTNVRMSEKIGVINSVAILDSESNLQYLSEDTQSIKENEMTRITITDNLIAMNGETQEIVDNILNKLNGLYYYANDFQTTGVCYYDFLDMFNVEARGNIYQCLLLNNEITITQGIEEHIFTEKFEEVETSKEEYTTSVMTNKQASLKIDQQEAKIEARVEKDGIISAINLSPEEIQIEANKISLEGKEINLTSDNIIIESDNFSVDEEGNLVCNDAIMNNMICNNATANGLTINDGTINLAGLSSGTKKLFVTYSDSFGSYQTTVSPYSFQCFVNNTINTSIEPSVITLYNSSNNSTIFMEGYDGTITCVSLTQTSKEENKKNFEKLTNAKDILNQVDIYKYNFKDENDNIKKSIGFVIGDDFNYSQEITSKDNEGANIYSMVSVLWQVVKEQQEEINQLKEMIKNGKY